MPVETFEGATESSTSVQDIEPGSIEEGSVEEATDTIAGKQLTSSQVQSPGSVVSFTLINADTDQPIAAFDPLTDGATIVLGDLPTVNLNIRANCDPEQVGSVRFAFDNHGAFRTENFVPYALAGDRKGDYFNWTPFVGTHTLSATPFSSSYANGAAGVPHTIQFNVEAGQTDALTVSSFTLIDADADEPIPGFDPIPDNAVIALSTLPTTQLNVRANTNPQVVGSVRFHVNDQRFRTENVVPYALAGDRNADYFVWDYELGSYEITATPYTNARATGAPGQPGVIAFTLVDTLGCSSDTDCMDDSFCNGVESCQEGACVSGEDPCNDAEICNEDENVCEPEPACFVDSDCDNRLYCDGAELCEDGVCVNGTTPCTGDETCNEDNDTCVAPPECTTNSDCEDNLFCNGSELCEDGKCLPGPTPCTSDEICVEATDACVECVNDLQCNDGLFCTGAETCNDGECVSSGSPCSSNEICNESQNKCDAPDGPMVVSFTLINADTNEPIETFDPFVDGALLNFPDLPTTNLSVRANTDPSPTGSVRFALDDNDNFQTENLLPYAIAGDSNGNYNPWTPDVGIRVLTATPFTSSNGNGTAGTPLSITFFVTDMDDPPNMAPTADAGDNLDVPASTTQVTLNGSGSDADGFIESYEWVQLTGPTATLTNSDSPSVTLSDLQEAVYVFLLRVTDNDGAQGSDEVQVTVGEPENTGVVSGELKTWHKVTVTFDGPPTTESSNTNPFADYRLNVTFTNGARSYTVPGYYAADGNAGETSADSGNKWRVHFLPDAEGAWSYLASFRIGNDIAVSLEDKVGVSTSFDGASGTFFVEPTDKTGRDHRGKGLLQYVDGHHFQ
ncbi:MAG: PKD domain-containing protein, partial [Phycisphaerae bacterium]